MNQPPENSEHPDVIYRGARWRVEQKSSTLFLIKPRYGYGLAWLTANELAALPFWTRGKPLGKHARLSDDRLRELHVEHIDGGKSIRQLGREIWMSEGFRSDRSASAGISDGFKRLGLERRLRSVATAASNRKRRDTVRNGHTRAEYRRLQRMREGGQRKCRGVKENAPGKGQPCDAWALSDSEFCRGHDPRFQEELQDHLAGMRAKIGAAA